MEEKKDIDVTGALSKRQHEADSPKILAEAVSTKLPLAMLIVDIDDFKKINEQIGHPGADEVLKLLVGALQKTIGQKGVVYRIGGDEFAVILPNYSIDEAEAAAKRVKAETSLLSYPQEINVTITIGVSAWPTPVQDIRKVLEAADRLLLDGKQKGLRDKIHIASSERVDMIGANEWRMRLLLSPETALNIPKHQLLDYLLRSCYSVPLDNYGRRYQFPLFRNRSNVVQGRQECRIGAKVQGEMGAEVTYEIANNGSTRLTIMQSYASPTIRAVQGNIAMFEAIRYWPFVTRFWKQFQPQAHSLSIRLDGIGGALLSIDSSTYFALNLISKDDKYEEKNVQFLIASGIEGASELLLKLCHNIVTAFLPRHGVSRDDIHLDYFRRKAESYLKDVGDPVGSDE